MLSKVGAPYQSATDKMMTYDNAFENFYKADYSALMMLSINMSDETLQKKSTTMVYSSLL